jgi:hypothetical protein
MKNAINKVWKEATDVSYICAQPGIKLGFKPAKIQRADNNPVFNGEPWYKGINVTVGDNTPSTVPQNGRGYKK